MTPLKISIVTVVLNSVDMLQQCLDSVWSQRAQVLEHVIIDGGSTDGSLELLTDWQRGRPEFVKLTSGPDKGIADAFNKGISAASGEWIGILNADDWYEPHCLAMLLPLMGKPQIIHGRIRQHDATTGQSREVGKIDYDPKKDFQPFRKMPAQHPTCFVPREIYQQVGMFDNNFKIAMDYEFLLRAHIADVPFHYVPEVITNFSTGGVSAEQSLRGSREVMAARILHTGQVWSATWQYLGKAYRQWRRSIGSRSGK